MSVFSGLSAGFEDTVSTDYHSDLMPRVCETVGLISAAGGCGTTTAAIALCRVYASLFEYKTLYVSLDYLSSKSLAASVSGVMNTHLQGREAVYGLLFENQNIAGKLLRDEYGVYCFPGDKYRNSLHFLADDQFYKLISILENSFDRIVIDIPLNCPLSSSASELCDILVVCKGWQEDRMAPGNELYAYLKNSREGILDFAPEFEDVDPGDIYGRFGAEVRNLAETIEGR